jgi:hypothetical protein
VLIDHSRSAEGLSPRYAAPEQFTDERYETMTDFRRGLERLG